MDTKPAWMAKQEAEATGGKAPGASAFEHTVMMSRTIATRAARNNAFVQDDDDSKPADASQADTETTDTAETAEEESKPTEDRNDTQAKGSSKWQVNLASVFDGANCSDGTHLTSSFLLVQAPNWCKLPGHTAVRLEVRAPRTPPCRLRHVYARQLCACMVY